jgi:hypothetical protein
VEDETDEPRANAGVSVHGLLHGRPDEALGARAVRAAATVVVVAVAEACTRGRRARARLRVWLRALWAEHRAQDWDDLPHPAIEADDVGSLLLLLLARHGAKECEHYDDECCELSHLLRSIDHPTAAAGFFLESNSQAQGAADGMEEARGCVLCSSAGHGQCNLYIARAPGRATERSPSVESSALRGGARYAASDFSTRDDLSDPFTHVQHDPGRDLSSPAHRRPIGSG